MGLLTMLLIFVFFVLFAGVVGLWGFFDSDAGFTFTYIVNHGLGVVLPNIAGGVFSLAVGVIVLFLPQFAFLFLKKVSYEDKIPGWVELLLVLLECAVAPLIFAYLFQFQTFETGVSVVTYVVSVAHLWARVIHAHISGKTDKRPLKSGRNAHTDKSERKQGK